MSSFCFKESLVLLLINVDALEKEKKIYFLELLSLLFVLECKQPSTATIKENASKSK